MITSASHPVAADELVALQNAFTGATLTGMANLARLLHGKPPVTLAHGFANRSEVVGVHEGVPLLRYAAKAPRKGSLLVVASLINRAYVLDLLDGISVVDGFCKKGFDVYVLDWQAPGREGLARTFADYVDDIIPWAAQVASGGGSGGVHVLGYCMGGTLAAMFAALHPEQVKALMLLGTPIDFHRSGILASFTKPDVFDADLLVDALGNVPPAMLQAAFKAMAPSTLMHKFWDLSDRAEDADAVIHYAAVERWLEDNISFPGGLYRPYIKGLYQENGLVKGTMKVGDRTVDLKKLAMPVLNIIGLKDNIVNVDGSRGLMPFLAQGKELAFDTGHIGLTTSKRAHRELWPQAHAWALEHA